MNDTLHARFAELQSKFSDNVNDKLSEIQTSLDQVTQSAGTEECLPHVQALEALVHKLTGISGTFSFNKTHETARKLELECDRLRSAGAVVDLPQVILVKNLFDDIAAAVDADKNSVEMAAMITPSQDLSAKGNVQEEMITILLVEDDLMQAEALQLRLVNLGFRVLNAQEPKELEEIDFGLPSSPDLVLMDIMIGQDRDAGLHFVRMMRDKGELNVPVVFTTARDDFAARIEAVRGGGDGYVVKPVNITHLVETIYRLTEVERTKKSEVLIVGANAETAALFGDMLRETNMSGHLVADPGDILEALKSRMPEVILLSTWLPDCTGNELASMVRQCSDDLARIPIVFFSDAPLEKEQLLTLRASGDDVLVLPVDPNIFVLSLESRCNRTRKVREIVKQKRTSEQRSHAIFESLNDAIVTTDGNDRILFWNRGAEHIFGRDTNDIIGLPVTQFFPARYHDQIVSLHLETSGESNRTQVSEPLEIFGLKNDGSEFPMELTATAWTGEHQRYVGYVIRDITERKKTEYTLESNRLELMGKTRILQTTMDSIDQGFVVWDADFKLVAHSAKCLDFWYRPPEETVAPGAPMRLLLKHLAKSGAFGEGDIEALADHQLDVVKAADRHASEEVMLLDDRIIEIHRFPLPAGGYVAKYTDITRQRNSEDILKKTANELTEILTTTSQGYWRFDNDGRTIEVNPRMATILGVQAGDTTGASVEQILGHSNNDLQDLLKENLSLGLADTFEVDLANAHGDTMSCLFSATPLNDETGARNGMFALVSDISDLRNNQLALENAIGEQEKANRAKSDFLSSMSHELRTPLNAILGFGQMLQLDAAEMFDPDQQDSVDQILKGGRHLLELVNDILDLSKIEAGIVDLEIEDVSPVEIIEECISLVSGMAEDSGIHIAISNQASPTTLIRADHTRTRQVMINLMSNAVKYNRPGGSVEIRMENSSDDMLRIIVSDTGYGISKDKQDQLFKPFSRLGAENSGIEGTGIGLVVTKDLVLHMNGKIGMQDNVGDGTTFWIELPLAVNQSCQANEA